MQKHILNSTAPRAVFRLDDAKVQSFTVPPTRTRASRAARRSATVTFAAVSVGEKAPDFNLKDQNGKNVKLSSFQGIFGKPVVLYFYPSDGSPGCTKQANAFKAAISSFKSKGAEVLGISSNDVDSHVEFKSQLDLPFRLLADEGSQVRKEWDVPKDLLGLLEGRQTYVIGKDGVVKAVYNNQFDPESHVGKALDAL